MIAPNNIGKIAKKWKKNKIIIFLQVEQKQQNNVKVGQNPPSYVKWSKI